MTLPVVCGAESTVVHTIFARPIVGALICVGMAAGGARMISPADQFGGCGTVGGQLMEVVQVTPSNTACAIPREDVVLKHSK